MCEECDVGGVWCVRSVRSVMCAECTVSVLSTSLR